MVAAIDFAAQQKLAPNMRQREKWKKREAHAKLERADILGTTADADPLPIADATTLPAVPV